MLVVLFCPRRNFFLSAFVCRRESQLKYSANWQALKRASSSCRTSWHYCIVLAAIRRCLSWNGIILLDIYRHLKFCFTKSLFDYTANSKYLNSVIMTFMRSSKTHFLIHVILDVQYWSVWPELDTQCHKHISNWTKKYYTNGKYGKIRFLKVNLYSMASCHFLSFKYCLILIRMKK